MSRVVVLLEPTFLRDRENGEYAARFRSLGLTAYGDTRDEALTALKDFFAFFVRKRRENGTLEWFLDKAGVEWYPEDKYPHDPSVIEYLGEDSEAASRWIRVDPTSPYTTLAA